MVVVAIIGIMAGIALPVFTKYVRRARTVEATMLLRKMYDGSAAYFIAEHADSAGVVQSKRFPGSIGPTPAVVPQGVSVLPTPNMWSAPEWEAIDFSLTDPHRFSYEFISNGATGAAAQAQLIAYGDLDGDTVTSFFERIAQGSVEGVSGGNRLIVLNELE